MRAADSINLDITAKKPNCNFYKWSAQMFLWLTSPATGYERGGQVNPQIVPRVFGSPIFFEVRGDKLVPQREFGPRNLALRATKFGPDGLPVVVDARGHLREFVTAPSKSGVTPVSALGGSGSGQIANVRRGNDGKAEFLDPGGKALTIAPKVTGDLLPRTLGRLRLLAQSPNGATAQDALPLRQEIADALSTKNILIKIDTKSGPVFVDSGTRTIDDLGPGQASTDGVLISQQNGLIFYEKLVNDVYAYYLFGRKTPEPNGISPYYCSKPPKFGHFPITEAELKKIESFSQKHGGLPIFPDRQALAVEVKLSWVDASTLPNGTQGYITASARLPTYDKTNPTDWAPNGETPATVALVGAHIVGSVNGHPEMVWSTFEHQANSPLAKYQYKSGNKTVTVTPTPGGAWLFSNSGAPTSSNTQSGTYCSSSEVNCTPQHIFAASPPTPIGPTSTVRTAPWGVAFTGIPNQQDATPADANTEVISLDTDVRSKLLMVGAGADPRSSYLFIGSTWTLSGAPPKGAYEPTGGGNEIGTNMLANSTMETFAQPSNCFDCHTDRASPLPTKADTSVSHIFSMINPCPGDK